MLSSLSTVALTRAIIAGDAAALIVVPGVGKRVAQRVILDLREKLGGVAELTLQGPEDGDFRYVAGAVVRPDLCWLPL